MREEIARGLESARKRTLALTEFDDPDLTRQHSPLMSPLVWDLAHVGQQEDLWLLRSGNAQREGVLPADVERLYDAFLHPRHERPSLPLLSPAQSRQFLTQVRGRILDVLDVAEDLFPFVMVEQHEQQHDETMLATHQLRDGPPLLGVGTLLPPGRPVPHDAVLVPAGEFVLGVDAASEPSSLDNEHPAHVVDLPAFRIGRVPVTNSEWQGFVDDGGYAQRRWWSARGWAHRLDSQLERPLFWSADGRVANTSGGSGDAWLRHIRYFIAITSLERDCVP